MLAISQNLIEFHRLGLVLLIRPAPNNLYLILSTFNGKILTWKTSGQSGFTGAQKLTYIALYETMDRFIDKLRSFRSVKRIHRIVWLGWPKFARSKRATMRHMEVFMQKLRRCNLLSSQIRLVMKFRLSFNGCRLKKQRSRKRGGR